MHGDTQTNIHRIKLATTPYYKIQYIYNERIPAHGDTQTNIHTIKHATTPITIQYFWMTRFFRFCIPPECEKKCKPIWYFLCTPPKVRTMLGYFIMLMHSYAHLRALSFLLLLYYLSDLIMYCSFLGIIIMIYIYYVL